MMMKNAPNILKFLFVSMFVLVLYGIIGGNDLALKLGIAVAILFGGILTILRVRGRKGGDD